MDISMELIGLHGTGDLPKREISMSAFVKNGIDFLQASFCRMTGLSCISKQTRANLLE